MDAINPYMAQQVARGYTRDRIRHAEAARAARAARYARTAARERRRDEEPERGTSGTAVRRWWWVPARRAGVA